jgi:hypothetical protein
MDQKGQEGVKAEATKTIGADGQPVGYDYWTLKDKEFFKGTEKPCSAPKRLDAAPQPPAKT